MNRRQDDAEARWQESLAQLRSYTDVHDDTLPHGTMFPARVAALEAIEGWEWRPFDAAWNHMYQRLQEEAGQYGDITHLTQRSVVDGAHLGRWIMIPRGAHRRDQLTAARIRALEAIAGWNWRPRISTTAPDK